MLITDTKHVMMHAFVTKVCKQKKMIWKNLDQLTTW